MRTERRRLGDIGENVACVFLKKHGYEVVERNYLRKWGEIDVVAFKLGVVHFVEVKSISRSNDIGYTRNYIRPEENMHPQKIRRLERAVQTYLIERGIDLDWRIDLVIVKIDETSRQAQVEMIENVF